MKRFPLISDELLALPAAMTTVIAPSDRARRAFAQVWAREAKHSSGRDAVALPKFTTTKSFFATSWSDAQLSGAIADSRALVPAWIETALWRDVAASVVDSGGAESLALADRLAEAWMLEHGYRKPGARTVFASGASGEVYRTARTEFVRKLREANAITAPELPLALVSAFAMDDALKEYAENPSEPTSCLDYFNQHYVLTPQFASLSSEKYFFSLLNKNSRLPVEKRLFNISVENDCFTSSGRVNVADPTVECEVAIAWARAEVEVANETGKARTVAIVVPDLHRSRGAWLRALARAALPSNMSLGLAVSKYPWAAAGFTLVSAIASPSSPETIAQAMRHSRWGRSAATIAAINRRELELLRRGDFELTLLEFCEVPESALYPIGRRLASLIPTSSARTTVRTGERAMLQSRAQWRVVFEHFIGALTESSAALDSETFQLRESLQRSIEQWQRLDDWLPHVAMGQAQQELIAMTDQAAFQPGGSDAPVQVIGLLESAGVPFDAVWVIGMTERVLPEPMRLNPFLSVAWQREQQAGLASVDECEGRAKRLLQGWLSLSSAVTVSVADSDEGEPQHLSPLFANWKRASAPEPTPAIQHTAKLEWVVDESASIWKPLSTRGVRALEAQALCPRRGFAEGRLKLSAWPDHTDGLSHRVRGELVHAVAECLGRLLLESPMAFDTLMTALPAAIDQAIMQRKNDHALLPRYVWGAERARLLRVFEKLIAYEAERSAFSVFRVEHVAQVRVGEIDFALRIDRVDHVAQVNRDTGEIASQGLALIDFKSGYVDKKGLYDERLTAPQLPLYAQAMGVERVEAVAYARASDDHQDFVSIGSASSGLAPSARVQSSMPSWELIRDAWREKLEILSGELVNGNAVLAPVFGKKTCDQCGFQRFCRVDFQALSSPESGDDDISLLGDE